MNENQKNKFEQIVNSVTSPPHGGLATTTSNRFQDQPWYVKLWRYRWYLKIPYDAVRFYVKNRKTYKDEFWFAYSLAIGEAHYKMKWLYTVEEAMKLLENKRKK